jgi:hypothetical protein
LNAIERRRDEPRHFFDEQRLRRSVSMWLVGNERQHALDPALDDEWEHRRRSCAELIQHARRAVSDERRDDLFGCQRHDGRPVGPHIAAQLRERARHRGPARERRDERLHRRVGMHARNEANRAIIVDDVDHRPVGKERHGQPPHAVDQIFERDEWRQLVRDARQEGQHIALFDQGPLARSFGLLPFGNLDMQSIIRCGQCRCPLRDARFELAMRGPQCLFVLAQRPFGLDAVGHVDRVPQHVRPARTV